MLVESQLKLRRNSIMSWVFVVATILWWCEVTEQHAWLLTGKTAVIIITLARWDWFEQWQDGRLRHRGEEYEGIKNSIGEQMWKVCCQLFPQLDGKVGQSVCVWVCVWVCACVGWLHGWWCVEAGFWGFFFVGFWSSLWLHSFLILLILHLLALIWSQSSLFLYHLVWMHMKMCVECSSLERRLIIIKKNSFNFAQKKYFLVLFIHHQYHISTSALQQIITFMSVIKWKITFLFWSPLHIFTFSISVSSVSQMFVSVGSVLVIIDTKFGFNHTLDYLVR